MKRRNNYKVSRVVMETLCITCILITNHQMFAQGPLVPPSPPEPTMKTLDQVEPRIPINNLPFTITNSGAYYIIANLTGVESQQGISVLADNVTIDLSGFSLIGVPNSDNGIFIQNGRKGTIIQNGTIRNWGDRGVSGFNSPNCRFENLHAFNNGQNGLEAGVSSIISDCIVDGNGFHGISVSAGSSVQRCTLKDNGHHGLTTGADSTISHCTSISNGDDGFRLGDGSTISDSTASSNTHDGIQTGNSCLVQGNVSKNNGFNQGDGAGIYVFGNNTTGTRIVGNVVTGNDRGLHIDGKSNYIADNTVIDNTDNYSFAANNQLNILLGDIPESIDWPAYVKFAGSLTGNTGANGLTVTSSDVTIDLNGHSLIGASDSLNGILVSGSQQSNLVVRNGVIRGWGQAGLAAGAVTGGSYEDLKSSFNGDIGLRLGRLALMTRCHAISNGGAGITAGSGAVLTDCIAEGNGALVGNLNASDYSILRGCIARNNKGNGIDVNSNSIVDNCVGENNDGIGIKVAPGSTIINSTVRSNGLHGISAGENCIVNNCVAIFSEDDGIRVGAGSYVHGCDASRNKGDGIEATSDCLLQQNLCTFNGFLESDGAGIHVTSTFGDNHIEGNNVTDNDRGIDVDHGGNLIVGNTATGNALKNYDIAGTNTVGEIINVGALTGTIIITNANPWANFSY